MDQLYLRLMQSGSFIAVMWKIPKIMVCNCAYS